MHSIKHLVMTICLLLTSSAVFGQDFDYEYLVSVCGIYTSRYNGPAGGRPVGFAFQDASGVTRGRQARGAVPDHGCTTNGTRVAFFATVADEIDPGSWLVVPFALFFDSVGGQMVATAQVVECSRNAREAFIAYYARRGAELSPEFLQAITSASDRYCDGLRSAAVESVKNAIRG